MVSLPGCRSVSVGALILAIMGLQAPPAFAQPPVPEDSAPYRVKRSFVGCWEVKWPQPKGTFWPSETTWCFHFGRAIGGLTFDGGHGGDFCKRWHVNGPRLVVRDSLRYDQECLFSFSQDRQTLTLRDCPAAGDWKRDHTLSKIGWNCRTQGDTEPADDTDMQP